MESIIQYYWNKFVTISTAPFFYHFSGMVWFDTIIAMFTGLVDIVATYYILIIFLIVACYNKNYIFTFISNYVYKRYNLKIVDLPLISTFCTVWKSIKSFFSKK